MGSTTSAQPGNRDNQPLLPPCDGNGIDPTGTRGKQGLRTGIEGRPCRADIIHEEIVSSRMFRTLCLKGTAEIADSLFAIKSGLGCRFPNPLEQSTHGNPPLFSGETGQQFGLIESPLPLAPRMKGDWYKGSEGTFPYALILEGPCHQVGQGNSQALVPAVLESAEQLPGKTRVAAGRDDRRDGTAKVAAVGARRSGKERMGTNGTARSDGPKNRVAALPAEPFYCGASGQGIPDKPDTAGPAVSRIKETGDSFTESRPDCPEKILRRHGPQRGVGVPFASEAPRQALPQSEGSRGEANPSEPSPCTGRARSGEATLRAGSLRNELWN